MIIFLIFPTQLFDYAYLQECLKDKGVKNKDIKIYLIEEPTYFTKYKFHKLKLAFHRASMKSYYNYLKQKGMSVEYYEFKDNYLSDLKNHEVFFYNPIDHNLTKKILSCSAKKITMLETPEFITTHADLKEYYDKNKNKKFTHDSSFYRWQRNRLKILTPITKLSYDKENRLSFPKGQKDVFSPQNNTNKHITEAKTYVNKHFADNWGTMDNFIFPIDHTGAKKWLANFIKIRLNKFGKYEDAFNSKIKFGYHSILSPLLNIGLLIDKDILDAIHANHSKVPLNSLEGYIRQLIGWKQSMRYLYEFHSDKFCKISSGIGKATIIGKNYLNHTNKLSKRFWDATTGIPPIDDCIKKAYQYSYLHHIERLMVIGQFFLLTMVDPDEVYKWFISVVSIDSYEWVMVPNIYGMIMYADGGFMMSRPYFSSSVYIKKMNDGEYKTGAKTTGAKIEDTTEDIKEGGKSSKSVSKTKVKTKSNDAKGIKLADGNTYQWDDIWDALYYNLINTHYAKFKKIYATARNVYHWDNKTKDEQKRLIKLAKMYIDYL
uniref:Cryptochrome/DNA photolyase FAD-binding domain-containing protein n=1 Tax=viral metagenome TaxID=1070528 RepID=A0A6C0I236_9ZZZZ